TVHFLKSGSRESHILSDLRVLATRFVFAVLEIGEVDVYDAVQKTKNVYGIVAVGVVDDRQLKAVLRCDEKRLRELRHKMRRRHPVYVVTAHPLQLEKNLRQPLE